MGLGEMLGVKSIKFTTKTPMSLEELYEKIKDLQFEAGVPTYVKHGLAYVICFPKVDRENQTWIVGNKGKFYIQRSTVIAGLSETLTNALGAEALNKLTGGLTGLHSTFGSPKKTCMAQCDNVAEVIRSLDL